MDRWSAAVLAVVAVLYLLLGRRYPLDSLATPGPGIFPLAAGVALLAVAVWQFAAGRSQPPREPSSRRPALLLMSVVLVAYAAFLPVLGFALASFALVAIAARLMGLPGWWRPAALALGVTAVSLLLFARWLGVPLP